MKLTTQPMSDIETKMYKKLNNIYRKAGLKLCKSRGILNYNQLGRFYSRDIEENFIFEKDLDLEYELNMYFFYMEGVNQNHKH